MFNFTAPPPLSLYVHIPWCIRKCPYCDFNSHELRDEIPEQAYVEALMADLEQDLPRVWGRTVESVFIGGGTPSLFSPAAIGRLLSELRARLPIKPAAEITLEANPGTVDQERFRGFREAGINRLSIGIQSFDPALLQRIGRIHDEREALAAVQAAQQAGFDNLNLDLMFGLPGQTLDQALADLRTALDLGPAHISWYELTIEANTWFHRHPPERPSDELLWTMQEQGRSQLEAGGHSRYEVSAYSRDRHHCRHNLNYWQFGDYLGIGAGAHAKITDVGQQGVTRIAKTRHPRAYLEQAAGQRRIASEARLSVDDVTLEYALNALRLDRGFSAGEFSAATGLPFSATAKPLDAALAQGLLENSNGRIMTTARGQRYLNEVLQYWLTDMAAHA
jgi:oxygen-independent coproporphyrinogen-3 oxidase